MARQQQEIAQEQDRLKALDGGKLESMLAKIEDAKVQIERLNEEQIEHDSRTPGLHSGRKPLQDEYDRATGAVNGRKSELQKVRESIRSLERDRNDSLQAFGPDMDKLLRAIQNERGFRERPVGPVGQHIVLKNPVWLNVVDKSLGAVLSSFIVTSKADQTLLQGIMQRGRQLVELVSYFRSSLTCAL